MDKLIKDVMKNLIPDEKGDMNIKFRVITEKRNVLCSHCKKVYEAKIILMILNDETKAVSTFLSPVKGNLFVCDNCKEIKNG